MFRKRNKTCRDCGEDFYDSSKLRYIRTCNACLVEKKRIRILFAKYMEDFNTNLESTDLISVRPTIDQSMRGVNRSRRSGKVACTPDTHGL
jgi:hypothetical protein